MHVRFSTNYLRCRIPFSYTVIYKSLLKIIYLSVCTDDPPHPIGSSSYDWNNITRINNATVSSDTIIIQNK